jgi:hypothetical protein
MREVEVGGRGGRSIAIRGWPQAKKDSKALSKKKKNKLSVVVHACNPSYVRGTGKRIVVGRLWYEAGLGQKAQDPI